MKNIKKILVTMITIAFIMTLTGCGGPKTYDEISFSQYQEKIKNKDDFILFIGSETCSACSAYKIGLNKVIEKYHVDVKYLDIANLSDEQLKELNSSFYFSGTPTTIFIEDGAEAEDKKRIDGNVKYSKIVSTMQENGYIKEK